jgi:putative inorganic carbon (hco3(-)) transporter
LGFLLTLLYVIVVYVRPQEFVADIQGWPILSYLAPLCIAAVFLEGSFTAEKFRRSALNWFIILFWGSLVMSHVANFWLGGAIQAFDKFSKVAVLYFLILFTVDSWKRLRIFMWLMILLATFLAVQAIVQFYTGEGLVGGQASLREGDIMQARGIGIFDDPNDLALNIVPMVSFLLPTFHKGFLSRTWVTGILFLIPMITGIAYTRSRGGILGLAAVGWYYLHQRVGRVAGVVGLLLVLSMLMAIPRMDQLSAQEDSARARLDHWSYGLGLLRNHPLFGVGMDRFLDDYTHTAHNSFVLVVAEAGIVGGFIWVAMVFGSLRDLRLARLEGRAPPFVENLSHSLVGAWLGWMVCAFFLSQTYKFLSFIIMAMSVAVLNALARDGIEIDNAWGAKQWGNTLALTGVVVVMLHLAIKVLWSFAQD